MRTELKYIKSQYLKNRNPKYPNPHLQWFQISESGCFPITHYVPILLGHTDYMISQFAMSVRFKQIFTEENVHRAGSKGSREHRFI